jgi:hypothetical protein
MIHSHTLPALPIQLTAILQPTAESAASAQQPTRSADCQQADISTQWQTVGSAEFGDGFIHPVVTRFHARRL